MTWLAIAVALTAGLALSTVLTGLMRRYALAVQLLDRPNERSSHSVPTPRGGGVAIVASFCLLLAVLGLAGRMDIRLCAGLLGSGLLVAVLGFLDDRRGLPARVRFGGHSAAAVWALAWMGALPPLPVLGLGLDLGPLAYVCAALLIVWTINLFNFMDGIDGIASLQAISVALGGALAWWLVQPGGDSAVAVLFAACVGGFLIWNFPPARIFMGDAGSGFLGLVVAVLALWSARGTPVLFWAWLVLNGCFMVDATTTLLRRVRRGEVFHEAHRNHAYQYASRRYASHKRVSLAVLALNLLWLLPWALAVALQAVDGLVALTLAYAPLVALAFRFKAGDRKGQEAAA